VFSNHSIIDYGTFGFWTAYLAGGNTILADRIYFREDKRTPLARKVHSLNLTSWMALTREEGEGAKALAEAKNKTTRRTQEVMKRLKQVAKAAKVQQKKLKARQSAKEEEE